MLFSPTGVSECLREWGDLEKDYQHIQDTHRLYRVKLEEVTKLQSRCTSAIARHRKKLKELSSSLVRCEAERLGRKLSPVEADSVADIRAAADERARAFSEMEAFLPKPNGLYLTLVLGNVNVTLLNKQSKFAYKEEYEKFKLILTVILFLFSFTCCFLFSYRALDALFNFLLVWYYCTLTIRESILINNGSRIRSWWVFHHDVSTFLSGVMLTWPEGILYQMFRNQFLSYCLYQSFVQFLQYYYQSGCLYRLRALGERHNMDLTVVCARVEVSMQETVEVYLGDSAHITCQYNFSQADSLPEFVMFQWFVKDRVGSSRMRIYYVDENDDVADEGTEFSSRIRVAVDRRATRLTVQEVQLSDERDFICQVNGVSAGAAESKTRLRVFAPPEAPLIQGVRAGISVNAEAPSEVATCEARNGFPKANISWYKDKMPLLPSVGRVNVRTVYTVESSGLYSVRSTLEYRVLKKDKDANFSCELSFSVPSAIRTVESAAVGVTIHYPATMVELWRESPKGLIKEGDTVLLRCHGDGNPSPTFNFSREREPGAEEDLNSNGNVLMLWAVSRADRGLYRCQPQDSTKLKGEVELKVHYLDPAVVVPKEAEAMFKGEDLTASCNALSSLKTSTVWYKGGQIVGVGNTLRLQDATYETAGEYVCEVSVPDLPTLHTSGSVHIVVHGAPQLVGEEREMHLDEARGRTLNLSCEAHGHPAPSIAWIFDSGPVPRRCFCCCRNSSGPLTCALLPQMWREVLSESGNHATRSVVSVAVNSDIGVACNASNRFGADVRAFSIKAVPLVTSGVPFSSVEGGRVIIVVVIPCLLLLAVLGSALYFLQKKGKIPCGRSGKQDISSQEKSAKDDIVLEMKNNAEAKTEDTVLLKAVNVDKNGTNGQ
ncbi:cell surface glycoprotein MUC18 isoform X2 [Syngnathus scovelli]|uniref:cell surface glycoprotein MUC18 isoform X2 n=1 Tax=Syngnathus scovelli TaxID=161590 RepID=UPI002110A7A8|nr:ion channel TACAN isoform X2 [Syngnathus scovelli]